MPATAPRALMAAAMETGAAGGDFYVRYYVGHKGKFGHEFLEFEFRPDGKVGGARSSAAPVRAPAPQRRPRLRAGLRPRGAR